MPPRLGPLIWGLQMLGCKGMAARGMGFELQTESALGKRAVQQNVSETRMWSERSGKAAM